MKKADAPPAGWYPDPTGGARLWWWDGEDWTDARRAPANPASDEFMYRSDDDEDARAGGAGQSALGASAAAAARSVRSGGRQLDPEELMAQARRVARQEVERGVDLLSDRATTATRQFQSVVTEYGGDVIAWIRRAVVVVVLLAFTWFVLQALTQASAMDWLGERIDTLLNGVADVPGGWSVRVRELVRAVAGPAGV